MSHASCCDHKAGYLWYVEKCVPICSFMEVQQVATRLGVYQRSCVEGILVQECGVDTRVSWWVLHFVRLGTSS